MKSKLFLCFMFMSVTTILCLGCQSDDNTTVEPRVDENQPTAAVSDTEETLEAVVPDVGETLEAVVPELQEGQEWVKEDPSYSQLTAAIAAKDQKEIQRHLAAATHLKKGFVFPLDTFAVNEEKTLLIANDTDGTGILRKTGGFHLRAGGDIEIVKVGIVYLTRGDVRILEGYQPELID